MSSARSDGLTAMTDRDSLLAPFDALIGTWSTEAKHRLVDEVVLGSATFEWLEGGHFVVLRSHNDHELFPDAICVIGRPESGEGLVLSTSTRAAYAGHTRCRSRTGSSAGGATTPDSTSVPTRRSGLTALSSWPSS